MGLSCRNLIKQPTNPVQLISINSHEELVESSGQGCGGETLFSVLHNYLLHLKISSSLFMTFMCRFYDLAVWKRTYTCFLQNKVRQSGFFLHFRSDCGFGFQHLITEARGREKHENAQ